MYLNRDFGGWGLVIKIFSFRRNFFNWNKMRKIIIRVVIGFIVMLILLLLWNVLIYLYKEIVGSVFFFMLLIVSLLFVVYVIGELILKILFKLIKFKK